MISFSKFTVGLAALLSATFAAALAGGPGDSDIAGSDIYGGTVTTHRAFPKFIVALSNNGSATCGGVLVNANTIMTARHCNDEEGYDQPQWWRVRAGSSAWNSEGVEVGVSGWVNHPRYDNITTDNDISLWRLSAPIRVNSNTCYATLPAQGSDPPAGALVTTFGWGVTIPALEDTPTYLHQITNTVISRAACRAESEGHDITHNMFCTSTEHNTRGMCDGDSGSPVVEAKSYVLWGFVSWTPAAVCGSSEDRYDVLVRVGQYVDWIHKNKF